MSGPQPVPVPTPTPDVSHVALPNVPSNTYQLLSSLADAIDTANGHFNTHATKLAGISQETNGAVNNAIAQSQGNTSNALLDTWTDTQTDFSFAHDPLAAIIASSCMGGATNPLREVLNQHQSAIQTGLIAMENIQALQRSCPLQPPSAQQVEEWIQEVNNLMGALGNVNLTLETMILAIRNLNGGFAATCATGFTPGAPLPTFSKNAFASTSNGSGGGGKLTTDQLVDYIKSKGVSAETAEYIAMYAEDLGLNLDDVKSLLDTGANPDDILSLLENGKITEGNLNDVTLLLNRGVGDVTQVTNRLEGLSNEQLALMRARAAQSPKLSADDLLQLTDPNLKYDPNPKHDVIRPGVGPQPADGQLALDNSVSYKSTTTSRVGIDPTTNDIVVLDDTNNGTYHGHVETWKQLDQDQQNALINDGFITKQGRIILRDAQGNIIGYGRNVTKGK